MTNNTGSMQTAKMLNLRALGIHVAGAQTRKSAVVRGSFSVEAIHSGLEAGKGHEILSAHLSNRYKTVPIHTDQAATASPFFFEALSSEIGPTPAQDADTRLFETIASMDTVDIVCIDAPLSLPPCIDSNCISCAGIPGCVNMQTQLMQQEWELRREQGERKLRTPQPYLDRYFEYFARSRFRHPALSHCFEFDAVLGSGRGPMSARARFIAQNIKAHMPHVLILETNSVATTLGQALASGFQSSSPATLRNDLDHRAHRISVLSRLDRRKIACRGAGLHEQVYTEIASRGETFAAAMSALTARSLLAGQVFINDDFVALHQENPLKGWACLPREITDYVWKL